MNAPKCMETGCARPMAGDSRFCVRHRDRAMPDLAENVCTSICDGRLPFRLHKAEAMAHPDDRWPQ